MVHRAVVHWCDARTLRRGERAAITDRLDLADPQPLQREQGEGRDGHDDGADGQRQAEQDVEGNGAADDLLDVTADDRQLRHQPQQHGGLASVVLPAHLRQVFPGHHAETRRQHLQDEADDSAPQKNPEQLVARVPGQ